MAFQTRHESLDPVALAIDNLTECWAGRLILSRGNHGTDTSRLKQTAQRGRAVAFVTNELLWSRPWSPPTDTFHTPEIDERLEVLRFVPFAAGEHEGQRTALSLGAQMNLGAESTTGIAQCLSILPTTGTGRARMSPNDGRVDEVRLANEYAAEVSVTLEMMRETAQRPERVQRRKRM
ncbi:hypothetical protein HNQ08_002765 [Deinococcus humi]|uniref:Uncharacterized protein n=1 Tax=Deinococcus humi TaxID=662880 RepID=A0A7W8NDW5_9DEIO|nr:hypothetical protein [Deinococcus humi]GGO29883.1 hypothetical protein GCM10008949_23980 [Deinococcus humi]